MFLAGGWQLEHILDLRQETIWKTISKNKKTPLTPSWSNMVCIEQRHMFLRIKRRRTVLFEWGVSVESGNTGFAQGWRFVVFVFLYLYFDWCLAESEDDDNKWKRKWGGQGVSHVRHSLLPFSHSLARTMHVFFSFSFPSFFLRVSFVCEFDTRGMERSEEQSKHNNAHKPHFGQLFSILLFHWSETDVRERRTTFVFIQTNTTTTNYETRMALGAKIHKHNRAKERGGKKRWGGGTEWCTEQREKDTWPDSQQLCMSSSCECCTKVGGGWGVKWAWYDATCHARPNSSLPWHVIVFFFFFGLFLTPTFLYSSFFFLRCLWCKWVWETKRDVIKTEGSTWRDELRRIVDRTAIRKRYCKWAF